MKTKNRNNRLYFIRKKVWDEFYTFTFLQYLVSFFKSDIKLEKALNSTPYLHFLDLGFQTAPLLCYRASAFRSQPVALKKSSEGTRLSLRLSSLCFNNEISVLFFLQNHRMLAQVGEYYFQNFLKLNF